MKKILFILTALFSIYVQADEGQQNIATVDWTVTETLLALGENPIAVGDIHSYRTWVMEPKLPEDTIDLGIRLQPNFEVISMLSHDVKAQPLRFIHSQFYAGLNEKLSSYGRVYNVNFYQTGDLWQNILAATQEIAQIINKPQAAKKLITRYTSNIEKLRERLIQHQSQFAERPLAIVQFIDTRHLRIYGENSLFGAVAKQLGFQNAYLPEVNIWGFQNIEITELAHLPQNTRFIVVKPYPNNITQALTHNTLWQYLPLAKDALVLPAVWSFGGIPSAERFAQTLTESLIHGGEAW